jgi:hypothetical protein
LSRNEEGITMMYNIKAIPTLYNHVQFRSRLEARWAAFFDLAGIKWDYEPFDLDGWAPDFLLRLKLTTVLTEVKPFDAVTHIANQVKIGGEKVVLQEYEKAHRHAAKHQVALIGSSPLFHDLPFPFCMPVMPPAGADYSYDDIIDALYVEDTDRLWREAGNVVQWNSLRSAA